MTKPFVHRILCECDEKKGKHSNTIGRYRAFESKNYIILKCSTCYKTKKYLHGGQVKDNEPRKNDEGE